MRRVTHRLKGLGVAALGALLVTGPAAAASNTPAEQANKKMVLAFYAALNEADATHSMQKRIRGIAETYLSPDYIQHAEAFANAAGPGTPRDKLIRLFQTMPPMPASISPPTTVAVMAEADRVILVTARDMPDPATGATKTSLTWNMFRVANGKLAEHWDCSPNMGGPPPPAGGTSSAGAVRPQPDAARK
jgi:predicted SnoaL-like aldol condensation-catalyzing enzyme